MLTSGSSTRGTVAVASDSVSISISSSNSSKLRSLMMVIRSCFAAVSTGVVFRFSLDLARWSSFPPERKPRQRMTRKEEARDRSPNGTLIRILAGWTVRLRGPPGLDWLLGGNLASLGQRGTQNRTTAYRCSVASERPSAPAR